MYSRLVLETKKSKLAFEYILSSVSKDALVGDLSLKKRQPRW